MNKLWIIGILLAFACSCENHREKRNASRLVSEKPLVKIRVLKPSDFSVSISSTGKLEASQKATLRFENPGVVERILVANGDRVKKGDLIASQDSKYLVYEIDKNEEALKKANLDVTDYLLGAGYAINKFDSIPQSKVEMARIRSRVSEINYQIETTKRRIQTTKLVAPFSGVIANMSANESDFITVNDKICAVINNELLFVSFFIFESQFELITAGDTVEINTLMGIGSFKGVVKSVNPTVDKNGFVEVRAAVKNDKNKLIDGMSVSVRVVKTFPNKLVLSRQEIVERQGRNVVFKYKNGKTIWTYVKTGQESADSFIIEEGLNNGDTIIVEGHKNLGHNVAVSFMN